MPITFQCDCGRKFRTADANAGRTARCPECGVQRQIPMTDAAEPLQALAVPEEGAEEGRGYNLASEEVAPAPRGAGSPAPYDRPGRGDAYPPQRSDRPRYDDADRFVKRAPTRYGGGMTDKGAIAGILMMVGAVIWFVVGMAVGIVFIYPPILFILGLISFIKGLVNRS